MWQLLACYGPPVECGSHYVRVESMLYQGCVSAEPSHMHDINVEVQLGWTPRTLIRNRLRSMLPKNALSERGWHIHNSTSTVLTRRRIVTDKSVTGEGKFSRGFVTLVLSISGFKPGYRHAQLHIQGSSSKSNNRPIPFSNLFVIVVIFTLT